MISIRSLYWPGFVLGMLLMTTISCVGFAMFFGINQRTLLDIQASGEPVWTPPPPTPTAEVQLAQAPRSSTDATEYAFRIGETVRNITSSRVNIRRSPGYRGKSGDDILAQAQPGDSVVINAGPNEADSLLWWLVQYQSPSGVITEGWMAEATGSGVVIMGP
ncbi:MAG: hypothetical protein AAF702_13640 [Chloroflexota bacterium]